MTQTLNEGGTIAVARQFEQYDRDEDITLSTTYTNILPIDAQRIRESTIQFTNKGVVAVTYKIFGSALKGQTYKTINPEDDDAWINLLSSGTYDHETEVSIPTSVLALGTLTLVSAIAGDLAVVNGLTYTAVAGAKADDTEFSIDTSDTAAALDLADSIDDDTRTGITVDTLDVTATSSAGVVTIVASETGNLGNSIDISSVDSTITANNATLVTGFSARAFETFTNPWRYVIVMMKAASGTPTAKAFHRGES